MPAVLRQPLQWWFTLSEVLRVKDARSLADKKLARRIADVLEGQLSDQDSHSLSFYVRESSVTVFGNVRDRKEMDFVLELVNRIPGVNFCKSHLKIVREEDIF